jgi:hypothetical protein
MTDVYLEEEIEFMGKTYIFLIWYHFDLTIVYVFGIYDKTRLRMQLEGHSFTHLFCKQHIKDIHQVSIMFFSTEQIIYFKH